LAGISPGMVNVASALLFSFAAHYSWKRLYPHFSNFCDFCFARIYAFILHLVQKFELEEPLRNAKRRCGLLLQRSMDF